MKRRRREMGGAGWFVLASLIALFAALWTWTAPGRPERLAPAGEGIELHLLDNGFHTDLAVPRAAIEARAGPLAEAVRALPPGDWILIGWGDAKFYVDQSPITDRLPDGARAFFRPGNASVVMLDPAQQNPIALFAEDGRRTFRLAPDGFDALIDHVGSSRVDLQACKLEYSIVSPK